MLSFFISILKDLYGPEWFISKSDVQTLLKLEFDFETTDDLQEYLYDENRVLLYKHVL